MILVITPKEDQDETEETKRATVGKSWRAMGSLNGRAPPLWTNQLVKITPIHN